jgi:hypothetical protein
MVNGINVNGKTFTDICERYEIISFPHAKFYFRFIEFTLLISF